MESSFVKRHLHVEALRCVTLIDSGPIKWEPDSLVIIRIFWILTLILEIGSIELPWGQVQPVHSRWTSAFSRLCVSWSWTVQCCHPVPSPGRSEKMKSQKMRNLKLEADGGFTLRLMCSGFAAAPSSPVGLLSSDSALAISQTNPKSRSENVFYLRSGD